jgi:hypothetical protein
MGLFPVAQSFFGGDSNVTMQRFRKTRHRQTPTLGDKVASTRILKFISRAEHLAWRARWKAGRWVIRSPTPAFRDSILRQDEEYRQADATWELNHGPISGGARVLLFPAKAFIDRPVSLRSNRNAGGDDADEAIRNPEGNVPCEPDPTTDSLAKQRQTQAHSTEY